MLLVVFYHSILFWGGEWFTKNPTQTVGILKSLAGWMNSFHIFAFTLVSGYIFFYLKQEKQKYNKFLPFITNKAKRLLIPYVFIAIVWVVPVQYFFFRYELKEIISNFLFAMSPNQLWFIIMLFDVFLIFWPLSDFLAKHDLLGIIAVICLYVCGLVGRMLLPNVFQLWTALSYMPLFWLGFKLRQYGTGILMKIPAIVWVIVSVLLYTLTRHLSGMEGVLWKLLSLGFTFVTNVVGAMMAFVVLQKIASKVRWNNRVFSFFSKRSMPVYLLHQQVIYFFIYWLNGSVNPYLNAVVNFVFSLGISLLAATLLMKFKITKFLIGEK